MQWRAVRIALERYCGIGEYAYLPPLLLPPSGLQLQWDSPELARRPDAVALMVRTGDYYVIHLRTRETPESLVYSMLHELAHVLDHITGVRSGMTTAEAERRAHEFACSRYRL
jgi:hypothetical protein